MRKVAEKSYVPVVFLLDLAAELSGQMYRLRWLIETFFRMFKQLLGCRHLLSTKQNGVKIQVSFGIIACLLILCAPKDAAAATPEALRTYPTGGSNCRAQQDCSRPYFSTMRRRNARRVRPLRRACQGPRAPRRSCRRAPRRPSSPSSLPPGLGASDPW